MYVICKKSQILVFQLQLFIASITNHDAGKWQMASAGPEARSQWTEPRLARASPRTAPTVPASRVGRPFVKLAATFTQESGERAAPPPHGRDAQCRTRALARAVKGLASEPAIRCRARKAERRAQVAIVLIVSMSEEE